VSLLPQQILPMDEPFGELQEEGKVKITKNWWLLLYQLCLQTLGQPNSGGGGLPSSNIQELASADSDANDSDAIVLRRPISGLEVRAQDDTVLSSADLPDIFRALLLAQDPLLADAAALAQPVSAITPTGSPFTYTAPYWGTVVVNGGVVTVIALKRQGTSVTTGLTDAVVPVARGDSVVVTYSGAPTMTFIPGSAQ
jgi:hypothetical protein